MGAVIWQRGHVSRAQRRALLGQQGATVWLTGLSASGKTTIAFALEQALVARGHLAYVLDGDNIRHGLNGDLGFSPQDRAENIRRVGEVARLFADAGLLVITAFISPYRADRERVRRMHREAELPFFEVHVDAPLEVCEQRDPKGLYRRARAGQMPDFTGISAPYEAPDTPDLRLDTSRLSVEQCCGALLELLAAAGLLRGGTARAADRGGT